jgi:hypothetical protein
VITVNNFTKSLCVVAWTVIAGLSAVAQSSPVEKDFESKKSRYTFEHFVEGEDATSGYDYLYYKSSGKIVKIRSIWSASYRKTLRVEDFYFDGSDLVLFRKSTAAGRLLGTLKKGRNGLLAPKEEFHFAGGKLSKWIVEGKEKASGDSSWSQTEKEVLDQAKSQREYYKWLKEGKF